MEKINNTQKRVPKTDINFHVSLNDEQKSAKSLILDNHICLVKGAAGSGKTLLAANIALDSFFKKQIDKIIITRPMVSKTDMGFLPGDVKEKLDPWLQPIYSNLYQLYNRQKIDKMVEDGDIEISPIQFLRGRTFLNSIVIIDESQNLTHEEVELIIGRMGIGSKLIFTGDTAQIDLKFKKDSGISFFNRLEENVVGVKIITLLKNHRHEIVPEVLKVYQDYRD